MQGVGLLLKVKWFWSVGISVTGHLNGMKVGGIYQSDCYGEKCKYIFIFTFDLGGSFY